MKTLLITIALALSMTTALATTATVEPTIEQIEAYKQRASDLHPWEIEKRRWEAARVEFYNENCGPIVDNVMLLTKTILAAYPQQAEEARAKVKVGGAVLGENTPATFVEDACTAIGQPMKKDWLKRK